jgi:putative (di)nucleoside polyphosphate hydrolase
VPLDCVIEFKRDVYQLALTELSRFLRRAAPRTERPGGHHGQRYPRMASSVNVPPGSSVVSVTSVTTVTTVTVETELRETIESDCSSTESPVAQVPGLRD